MDRADTRPANCPDDLRRVLDVIEKHPEWDHSVISLAEHAAFSVKTLQLRFRDHLNTTPSAYLRDVRLDRIHDELSQGTPETTSLDEIALRFWYGSYGFLDTHYVRRFGEEPQQTLERPARRRAG